jgi:hypothetical protein
LFNKFWRREERHCARAWGTLGVEDDEPARPQFRGEIRRSPITDRDERFFPRAERQCRQFCSYCVIVVGIGALLFMFEMMFDLKESWANPQNGLEFCTRKGIEPPTAACQSGTFKAWGSTAVSFMQAVEIQVLTAVFNAIAARLNTWENHRTATAHEDNLIFKTFLFQIFNSCM